MDESKHRWFCPAPNWLVYGSLLATGLLFLSERWQWFPFNAHKGWTVLVAVAGVGAVLAAMLLWFVVALVFRRRFQFNIQSLLVLVVAVALPFSWLGVEMKQARIQKELVTTIESLGGEVWYYQQKAADSNSLPPPRLRTLMWPLNLLGGHFFAEANSVYLCQSVSLSPTGEPTYSSVVGVGMVMQRLHFFQRIQELNLDHSDITDTGCEYIGRLQWLKWLCLSHTHVTDAALEHVQRLSQLTSLRLNSTKVTDPGLDYLKGLTELQLLDLRGTKVTGAGVAKLQQALPHCKIEH